MTTTEAITGQRMQGTNQPQGEFSRAQGIDLVHATFDLLGEKRTPGNTTDAVKQRGNERRRFKTRLDADRRLVTQVLGITDLGQIDALRQDEELREQTKAKATQLLAGAFVLPKEKAEEKLTEYARTADNAVDLALTDFPIKIRQQGAESVVRKIDHPVDLLLLATDPNANPRDKYRALRKARLMQVAAEIDFNERRLQTDRGFEKFQNFLENDVLDTPTDEDREERFILTTHTDDEKGIFRAVSHQIVTASELDRMPELTYGQKLTPVQRRTYTVETPDGPMQRALYIPVIRENVVNVDKDDKLTRLKKPASMVLKTERKPDQTPTQAIDDQIGMMAVFEDQNDIFLFLEHMEQRAIANGSILHREEAENTLNGGDHKTVSKGSTTELKWYKSHLNMFGIRPEFIGFTPEYLANYLYQEGVSHREYTTQRLFRDGVAERFVPADRFDYEPNEVEVYALEKVRGEIKNPQQVNGYPNNQRIK